VNQTKINPSGNSAGVFRFRRLAERASRVGPDAQLAPVPSPLKAGRALATSAIPRLKSWKKLVLPSSKNLYIIVAARCGGCVAEFNVSADKQPLLFVGSHSSCFNL
jgi:hypothetical protein